MLYEQDKEEFIGKEMPTNALIGVEMHIHHNLHNVTPSLISQITRERVCLVEISSLLSYFSLEYHGF